MMTTTMIAQMQRGAERAFEDVKDAGEQVGVTSMYDLSLPFILVAFGAALAFLAARFWYAKGERVKAFDVQVKLNESMKIRIDELEKQIGLVGQTVQPISTAFQAMLIKQLTHFHTPVLDKLLEGIGPPYTLDDEQEVQLVHELNKRMVDMGSEIDDSERDAARMLPLVMRRVKLESETAAKVNELQVVIVPLNPEELGASAVNVKVVAVPSEVTNDKIGERP